MAYTTIPRKNVQLLEQIGVGGFSAVYKAKWRKGLWSKQEVAAKRLNMADKHEIEVLSQLDHPNIVKLIGVVDDKLEFFLILELCEGGSLRSYLNARKGKRLPQFYDWVKQAGRPIEYLREKKIVHKDIKSPNYLIAHGDVLKLADFGLAKNIEVTMSKASETASYPWMAPELLKEEKLSPSYDIYSYGVVIWELWTTEVPFKHVHEPAHLIWIICNENERPPIPVDCPKPLADLMRQCWETDWKKRPSMKQVFSALASAESAEKEARQRHWIAGPWQLEREFGQDGPGELYDARGIAVSPNGNIAVADYNAACVRVYSNKGGYMFSLDTKQGLTPGRHSYPWNVTVNADGIYYVTDETQYVKVYNPMGVYKCRWVAVSPDNKPSDTEDTRLCGPAMDANGHLLVAQVERPVRYISKHKQDGSHITSIKVGIALDHLAATSQDTIIICDWWANVQIVDNTGQVLHTLNQSRHLPFWNPRGVCCYNDIIFVANNLVDTHEITCFSLSGEYMGSIAIKKWPYGITFAKESKKLLVTCKSTVQIYSYKT